MVHTVEAACKLAGLDFLGWTIGDAEIVMRLRKGNCTKDVTLPTQALKVLDVEHLAVKIKGLFVGNPTCL